MAEETHTAGKIGGIPATADAQQPRPADTLTDTPSAAGGERVTLSDEPTGATAASERGIVGSVSPPPLPGEPTLRLAHDHKIAQTAEPTPDEQCAICKVPFASHQEKSTDLVPSHQFKRPEFKTPYHRPITIDAHVNIGMGLKVFFPSLEKQIAGFTPYYLDKDEKKQNATKIVLENFLGIYKSFTPGPEEKARLAEAAAGRGVVEGEGAQLRG